MDKSQKLLWDAMEQCRGLTEVSHLIELFSHVALIAKEAPESFQTIVNTGVEKQLEALTDAGKLLESRYPKEVCSVPDHYRVNKKVLSVAIQLLSKVKDFKLLAQQLREVIKNAGKFSGEIASNLNTERIFTALLGDCRGKSLYDGACGLARVASSLSVEKLYLEEKNHSSWVTAFRLLTLENKEFELIEGDSLLAPAFIGQSFDLAVMEPPFSLRFGADERQMLAEAPFLKIPAGNAVSASSGDSLWIQQALSNLNETGKGYILLPQGFLFRGGYDAKVREYLLENELLEAVIGLPASILDGTSIPPVILVLNKNKPVGSPVIFVDAVDSGTRDRNRVDISEEDASLIANLALGKLEGDDRYKAVFIPEIRENSNQLAISRYIARNIEVEEINLSTEINKLSKCKAEFEKHQQNMMLLLKKFQ